MSGRVSLMAENLIGSEIIKLSGDIRRLMATGKTIYNYTIGDFDPHIFPIPDLLRQYIAEAYENHQTNYPDAAGMPQLRDAVSDFHKRWQGIDYTANDILISAGARPLIYAIYNTIVDPGDGVVFATPSWNNNHYTHLHRAQGIMIEAQMAHDFMPTAADLKLAMEKAVLLCLCSPQNPTGTVFTKDTLAEICDAVLEINSRRAADQKPLYVLYDQMYGMLTYGSTIHCDPVTLRPAMRAYTVYVDGMSKSFAATGVRVGWSFGPPHVMERMKNILSHIGAWSPRAEQVAAARYLDNTKEVDTFLTHFKKEIEARLHKFYTGFMRLKEMGFAVDAIAPRAGIYLTVQIDLAGKHREDGTRLNSTRDVTAYLLEEANLALVPFYAFGAHENSSWYRLSVGTARMDDIDRMFSGLEMACRKLQ